MVTGYEVSKALSSKGANVIMACRNIEKAESSAIKIRKEFPDASLFVSQLDLSYLSSIKTFSKEFLKKYTSLDILCNNAGVMQTPNLKTKDGFELQFGTNHLGHFALTGLLLDSLLKTKGSRIVTVSSGVHRMGRIDFNDIMHEKKYGRNSAYAQSKLANLLFTYELQRLLDKNKQTTISVAAHPGYSATNLQYAGPGLNGGKYLVWMYKVMNNLFAQSAEMGALPILYVATAKNVIGGDYICPKGFFGMRGYHKKVKSSNSSYDEDAKKLWAVSSDLTHIQYNF